MGRGQRRRLQRQGRVGGAKGLFGPLGDLLRPGTDLAPHGMRTLRHPHATPFPRTSLRGASIRALRRQKPRGWRETPTREHEGFIWTDENGVERLRFMRPTGENPSNNEWSRQANGYFRWQSSQSAPGQGAIFLDLDGNPIPASHPEFQRLTHIMYEGLWP